MNGWDFLDDDNTIYDSFADDIHGYACCRNYSSNSGILFVCAAGNQGTDTKVSPFYPACYNLKNVISVGAIDNQGNIAEFSNYGNGVDALAPGFNIIRTIPSTNRASRLTENANQ
ncbi:MAG: S8 family serine peptidase [Lachnotalea sp.]